MEKKSRVNKEVMSDRIKDPKLKELFLYLSSSGITNSQKVNWEGSIDENIKQYIKEAIQDKIHDISENFSELRKKGKDIGVLNYKMMILPLKLKMFLATYEKKDAENVISRIREIEKELR